MSNVKRLYISLVELVVGLVLLSLAIGFLFRYLTHVARIDCAMQHTEEQSADTSRAAARLSILFQKATSLLVEYKEGEPILILRFDNGVDPDPLWSGKMVGRLRRTEEGDLLFSYAPEGRRIDTPREEILFPQVADVEWTFWKGGDPIWITEWRERTLPPTIRLKVGRRAHESLQFAFFTSTPLRI